MIPAQKLVHRAQTLAQELLAEAPGRAEEEEGEEREGRNAERSSGRSAGVVSVVDDDAFRLRARSHPRDARSCRRGSGTPSSGPRRIELLSARALCSHSSRNTVSGLTLRITARTSSADFRPDVRSTDQEHLVPAPEVPQVAHRLGHRRRGERASRDRAREASARGARRRRRRRRHRAQRVTRTRATVSRPEVVASDKSVMSSR